MIDPIDVILRKRDGIVLNLFLLPNWSQSSEDIQFSHRLAENTGVNKSVGMPR